STWRRRMRVACARRNESQAASLLPLGSSSATSRLRRPAVSDLEGTCIRNNSSVGCLHSQVYLAVSKERKEQQADEYADFDRCAGRYLEPRSHTFARRLRGSLPRR